MSGPGFGPLLDSVRGVRWPAKRPVGAAPSGAHHSRQRGSSPEFAEYRAYRQGDDPRRIDWRLLARTDRVYLRHATDRASLSTLLVVDASASMAFPESSHDKWRTAAEVTVALAAVAHAQGDPVGLVVPHAARPRALPLRSRRGVVSDVARVLSETTPQGDAPLSTAMSTTLARRIVVVTDLLGDAEGILGSARTVVARGGEVHLVHVVARDELDPQREMLAVDPENTSVQRPFSREGVARYQAAFAAWRESQADAWCGSGATYTLAVTDEDCATIVRRIADPRGSAA